MIAQLAIAEVLAKQESMRQSEHSAQTTYCSYFILVFVVYIFAALTFFPALALGPIAEHLVLWMP